jgi:hypothetical protein
MLGSPRTGSTWLLNLLGAQPGCMKIDEPGIGVHLGLFLHEFFGSPASNFAAGASLMTEARAEDHDYFFADAYADVWKPGLRRLMLERFAAQADRQGTPDAICLVKEPNGSQAAGMLVDALPESRLLWVVRDGRDVIDSELDGLSPGGWTEQHGATWEMSKADRLRFVEDRAYRWVRRTELTRAAFDRLPDERRRQVHYEELRADTPAHLAPLLDWLGRSVPTADVRHTADRMSFERLPEHLRGRGKFARSATQGGWRDNLDKAEQEVMERVMGAELSSLGYS